MERALIEMPVSDWGNAAEFPARGACHLPGAALQSLTALNAVLDASPRDRAGLRLQGVSGLSDLVDVGSAIHGRLIPLIPAQARPVRALLFDKTPVTNWSLAWHQDRTIAVRERRDVEGFGPWTVKSGLLHVAPPFDLLERMVTVRIHLDDVGPDNAPLRIAPGSHRIGRVCEAKIADAVDQCGVYDCTARAGDVWVYATPILHASDAAVQPGRRRVLQLDYADFDLPAGLIWSGI